MRRIKLDNIPVGTTAIRVPGGQLTVVWREFTAAGETYVVPHVVPVLAPPDVTRSSDVLDMLRRYMRGPFGR